MQDIAKIQSYYESSEQFPVPFDEFWQWAGYSRKDTAKRTLENNFVNGVDFNLRKLAEVQTEGKRQVKREKEYIFLTIDCAKSFAMLADTEVGKQIRQYFLACEKKLEQASTLWASNYEEYKKNYLAFCKTYATISGFAFRLNRLIENELSDILALYEMGIKPEDMYLEYENLHTPKSDKGGDHEGGSPTVGKSAVQLQASPDYMSVKDYFLLRGVDLTPAKVSEANKICTRLSRTQQKMSGTFGHSVPTFCVEVLAEVFEQFSAKEGATHAK